MKPLQKAHLHYVWDNLQRPSPLLNVVLHHRVSSPGQELSVDHVVSGRELQQAQCTLSSVSAPPAPHHAPGRHCSPHHGLTTNLPPKPWKKKTVPPVPLDALVQVAASGVVRVTCSLYFCSGRLRVHLHAANWPGDQHRPVGH